MTRLFTTGASGYIGGDFLAAATQAHPKWEISCLVRDRSKASTITLAFPRVRIVHGDLDSVTILEDEASRADIVYSFANCDHVKSARAIAKGLARNRNPVAFWIHTSGAGILTHQNFAHNSYGYSLESDSKVYDDWEHVSELTSLPDKALHRHVDKIVLAASRQDPTRVKTAIVCPPCIYGFGRGTGNVSSVQVHVAAQVILAAGRGLQVGDGSNTWHEVHVHDLSTLYVLLGEAAASGGGRATWNEHGYYLAESGSFTWGAVMNRITHEAWRRGFIRSATVESVGQEAAKAHHRYLPYLCATTSRGTGERAKRLLSWRPSQGSMTDEVPNIVSYEAERLSLRSKKEPKSTL